MGKSIGRHARGGHSVRDRLCELVVVLLAPLLMVRGNSRHAGGSHGAERCRARGRQAPPRRRSLPTAPPVPRHRVPAPPRRTPAFPPPGVLAQTAEEHSRRWAALYHRSWTADRTATGAPPTAPRAEVPGPCPDDTGVATVRPYLFRLEAEAAREGRSGRPDGRIGRDAGRAGGGHPAEGRATGARPTGEWDELARLVRRHLAIQNERSRPETAPLP